MAAADLPEAEQLAAALALEKVPAGFVFHPNEGRADKATQARIPDGPPVPVSHVVNRFLATHPAYAVGRSDWALVIQPKAHTMCGDALNSVLPDSIITEPAYVAFWKLAQAVNPADTPKAAPAVVCGGGNCNSAESPAHRARVAVTLRGTTLQEALSNLVAQSPGLVWTLREKRRGQQDPVAATEAVCQFGYFDGDQYVQTSYVFGKTPTPRRH